MKNNSYAGTLLLQHPHYNRFAHEKGDKFFKECCCHYGVMQANSRYCMAFTERRPIDDGARYRSPDLGDLYSHYYHNCIITIIITNV